MKFYYIVMRYDSSSFDGRQFTSLYCGVSHRHPFKVLSGIRQADREMARQYQEYRRGILVGPSCLGRHDIISWQEISEDEYQLARSIPIEDGICDFDAGNKADE